MIPQLFVNHVNQICFQFSQVKANLFYFLLNDLFLSENGSLQQRIVSPKLIYLKNSTASLQRHFQSFSGILRYLKAFRLAVCTQFFCLLFVSNYRSNEFSLQWIISCVCAGLTLSLISWFQAFSFYILFVSVTTSMQSLLNCLIF